MKRLTPLILVAVLPLSAAGQGSLSNLDCPLPEPERRGSYAIQSHAGVRNCTSNLWEASEDPSAGRAFLYSAVLPGSGQAAMGSRRWVAYAAVEVVGWLFYADARTDVGRLRGEYRDLAWEVARARPDPRQDGRFEYYEALAKFERSGAFDRDPVSAGLQPELDGSTFNGRIWNLATEIFFPAGSNPVPGTPVWEQALDYYRERAAGETFLWDWDGNTADRSNFKSLIRESDDRSQDASLLLGAVVANHLVSALDAYLTTRSRGLERISISFGPGAGATTDRPRFDLMLSVRQ